MKTRLSERRDFFATNCPDSEIEKRTPRTVVGVRDELIRRGIIPISRKAGDVFESYNDKDMERLRCLVRFEYADDMISSSNS